MRHRDDARRGGPPDAAVLSARVRSTRLEGKRTARGARDFVGRLGSIDLKTKNDLPRLVPISAHRRFAFCPDAFRFEALLSARNSLASLMS